MIQLRPPTDADNYRVQAGRFGDRFYTDPLPADDLWAATTDDDIYPAISTVKKATGQDWSRAMAKRLAKDPKQLAEIARIDSEFERKQRLNLASDAGLDQASGRGTIVHAHAEAVLANRLPLYQMNETVKPYIRTLDAFLAAFNPVLRAAEFVAIHRDLNAYGVRRSNEYQGYGGTGDAVLEIDGGLYLTDWKSRAEDSDHRAYPEEGAQISAYGRAQYWIIGDDESPHGAKRITPLDLAGGLIVSIKPDSYECFPIDLDEGFDYWVDLHAWWQARRSERRPIGRKWAPRVTPASQLVTVPADAVDPVTGDEHPHAGCTMNVTGEHVDPPTPASNKARFDALHEVKKVWAREAFKSKKLNPNDPATAGEVSRIIGDMEQRPTLREAQEQRAEQVAEHTERTAMSDPVVHLVDGKAVTPMEMEGGEAPDDLVTEARVMFEMVIGSHGRQWTGFRVKEANEAGVPFRLSLLPSLKRAHLYGALCLWVSWRDERLLADEAEGNPEFAAILYLVDDDDRPTRTLGHRLGDLDYRSAAKFAALIIEVVQSETGDNLGTGTETQPASQPEEK